MFQRRFSIEEYGFLTVTEVRVSPDLRVAKIFVSIFGDAERKKRSLALLENQKPSIRSAVGKAVRLRFTPEIAFLLDDTMDKAMDLEALFKRIRNQEQSRSEEDPSSGTS